MNNKLVNVGNIIRVFLQMFLVFGIIILIFLVPITKLFHIHFDFFIFMIYPCGLLFLGLVFEFIKLFKTLEKNNPFCIDNVKRFKNNMFISFSLCFLIFIALLISNFCYDYYSPQLKVALLFISILFFCIAIAFYILSELFNQATLYKEENDLTI